MLEGAKLFGMPLKERVRPRKFSDKLLAPRGEEKKERKNLHHKARGGSSRKEKESFSVCIKVSLVLLLLLWRKYSLFLHQWTYLEMI